MLSLRRCWEVLHRLSALSALALGYAAMFTGIDLSGSRCSPCMDPYGVNCIQSAQQLKVKGAESNSMHQSVA
jgi:hypothetical protein